MVLVFFCVGTGNEEVIDVCITEVQTMENLIDKMLEGLGCIM